MGQSLLKRERGRRAATQWIVGLLAGGVLACTNPIDGRQLPPDVQDPAAQQNPSGAIARYQGTTAMMGGALDSLGTMTGILTDELAGLPMSRGSEGAYTGLDNRQSLSYALTGFEKTYASLNRLRGEAREARGFVQAYAADSASAELAGHLYALEGMAEILLADVFCSGIPLSTVDFHGDYTLATGSSTQAVYEHAIMLLDSAVALLDTAPAFGAIGSVGVNDLMTIQRFAAVERGRAFLALGRYAEAGEAVRDIPTDYGYTVGFYPTGDPFLNPSRLLAQFANQNPDGQGYVTQLGTPSVADNEGGNGLNYRSSGDPRILATALPGTDKLGNTMYLKKYDILDIQLSGGASPIVANGVEARLIEAEAALQAGDPSWLIILNALRTDGTQDGDGVYNWGTGYVAGLAPLEDPVDPAARVDLLFRERAFWLYLTGHRQGDLRRLVRSYHRPVETVFPFGAYPGGSGSYGANVVVPVPAAERELNPKYTGCFNLVP